MITMHDLFQIVTVKANARKQRAERWLRDGYGDPYWLERYVQFSLSHTAWEDNSLICLNGTMRSFTFLITDTTARWR